jgi:uncharacterized protein (TIGR03118 family)
VTSGWDIIARKGITVVRKIAIGGLSAALFVLIASPAQAAQMPHAAQSAQAPAAHVGPAAQPTRSTAGFTQINQVSDQPGVANLTDPDLVNAWGLALSPTSPLWSANNGTNTATLYSGGLGGAAVGKVGLTVAIPGGAPTGQVFNDSTDATEFVVSGPGGSGPAAFMFVTEGGDLIAWNRTANGTTAAIVKHVPGAVFKGLALAHTPFGSFLLATDFHHARVDVFDSNFHLVRLPRLFFHDPKLPHGYAPFNVLVNGSEAIVTYAKQGPGGEDEVDGQGLGFVDAYRNFGLTVHRIASRGTLNAPWGLTVAPAGFGNLGGSLLVGNFGDGRINVFTDGHFVGQLRDTNHHRITIDGLWDLLPGTASTGGVGTVWFSAGPDDESHGLLGQLVS